MSWPVFLLWLGICVGLVIIVATLISLYALPCPRRFGFGVRDDD